MTSKKLLKYAVKWGNKGLVFWSLIGLIIVAGFLFYLLHLIKAAVIPLIIAIAIAYLLTPLVLLLQKKIKKIFAVAISYIVFLGAIFVFFFLIIPVVAAQLQVFIDDLPSYLENLTLIINKFLSQNLFLQSLKQYLDIKFMPEDASTITKYLLGRIDLGKINIFQQATAFTKNIINWLLNLIVGPFLGFYMLKDAHKLRNLFLRVLPSAARTQASEIMDKINMVGGRYLRGQILISMIVGLLCTIILLILGVDFALLLGFTAGILNLIPFLGPVLGAVPAALTALLISPVKALLVVLLFIAVQQVDNYFITPNIMKYQVRVHPAIIIISLIAGGALFGIWGLLLSVPVVAIIQELLKYYLLDSK